MVSMLLNTIDDAKQNARGFFYRFNARAHRRRGREAAEGTPARSAGASECSALLARFREFAYQVQHGGATVDG